VVWLHGEVTGGWIFFDKNTKFVLAQKFFNEKKKEPSGIWQG